MAAANLNTIRATVEGRLFSNELDDIFDFDLVPSLDELDPIDIPVVFHNQPYVPTPNSSWVQCLVSFGASEYLTLGGLTDSSNSIIGVAVINIFTPLGVGPGANLTIGTHIRNLYNRNVVSGVHFDPPIGPEVVATPAPEGFFQTQVRLTFETFEDL